MLNRFHKITGVLFFLINFCFIWISTKIAEFITVISRLDESKGYMISEAEERKLFLFFSIPMLLMQIVFLFFIINYLRKKLYKKSSILVNVIAHLLLFLLFVFNVSKGGHISVKTFQVNACCSPPIQDLVTLI